MNEKTIPTYGYRNGEARIFQLKPGEMLPKGWRDTPAESTDDGENKSRIDRRGS